MANMSRTPLSRLTGLNDPGDGVHRVSRLDLQRVESELEAVVSCQQTETREVTQLKEEVSSLRNDLNAVKDRLESNQRETRGRQRKKIPPVLSTKIRNLHSNLENTFDPSQPYRSPHNQNVVLELCRQISEGEENEFEDGVVKHAVYRYYESRRKSYNDSQPARLEAAKENKKRTRKFQEQKRLFERRQKQVRPSEMVYWKVLTKDCMSDESDDDSGCKTRHSPKWRSQRLTSFLYKLDERSKKKLGSNSTRVIKRTYGSVRECAPPRRLPAWMVGDEVGNPDAESSPTTSASTSPPLSNGPSPQQQSTPRPRPLSELNLGSDSFWSATNASMYVFDECVTEV